MRIGRLRLLSVLLLTATALAGCTDEPTTELDLDGTIPATTVAPDEDPNAEARAEVERFARQQCLDDPTLEVGVVVIADAETGEEVNRFELPCDEAVADVPETSSE